VPTYGHEPLRARAEARQHRAADPGAARRARSSRLRDRPVDLRTIAWSHPVPRRVALSDPVSHGGEGPARRTLGREAGTATAAVLPADQGRENGSHLPEERLGELLRRAEPRRAYPTSLRWMR